MESVRELNNWLAKWLSFQNVYLLSPLLCLLMLERIFPMGGSSNVGCCVSHLGKKREILHSGEREYTTWNVQVQTFTNLVMSSIYFLLFQRYSCTKECLPQKAKSNKKDKPSKTIFGFSFQSLNDFFSVVMCTTDVLSLHVCSLCDYSCFNVAGRSHVLTTVTLWAGSCCLTSPTAAPSRTSTIG